ncbi:MAG TPA: bifunctional 5,10-methylenetetrahydrofolate dehydrogenase/5,10-methenyltetrahydrofolate cyclohydrolase, partial [Candidatus Saccharibacteria bacterium]|nr:bifunctional 5,10-methylenetetrahydrofolate dehydrogenase/5,10-methenyltetrahydrofolate cyclohydrolase [Candidatus Saccharibacteria bacterium]
MKILSGAELRDYIKERQAKQVRALRQAHQVFPKLAIIITVDDPVIEKYVALKQEYGEDILIDVQVRRIQQQEAKALIDQLNNDATVHGIIVQLPLQNTNETDDILNQIDSAKDVDGLTKGSPFIAATPMAIDWLLAGYNVDLKGKAIVVVGNGKLVGQPLAALWQGAGLNVTVCDDKTEDLQGTVKQADIIVTATGQPGLITGAMVKPGAVLVDAGTASENGKLVGDAAPDVRERNDITITPPTGGVGPLTVAALFDNLI